MEQINSNKKHSNRRKYFSLLAVVLFIAFSGAYAYWSMELEDMISTDDAYVTGNADPISAQVSGSVTVVNHKDTNYVRQGDWICPYISRHLLSLNPLLACCRRYSRGER